MKRFLCAALATFTLLLPGPVGLTGSTAQAAPLGSTAPTAPVAATTSTFSDVAANYWATSYIQRAYNNSWVRGLGDGRYAPNQPVTNAAFLTMITNVFFPEAQDEITVPEGSPWYALYWEIAQKEGITQGTTVHSLADVQNTITRYDMAQMIMNVLEKDLYIPEGAIQQVSASIQDWNEIPETYRHAVAAAYALKVLNGKEGRFAGADPMTRAESAVVLCRMNDAALNGYVPSSPTGTKPNEKPDSPPPTNGNPNGNTGTASGPSSGSTPTNNASAAKPGTTPSSSGTASPSNTATDPADDADSSNGTDPADTVNTSIDVADNADLATTVSSSDTASTQAASNTSTASSTSSSNVSDLLAEAIRLTNQEREQEGLRPLGTYSSLTQAAQVRASELKRLFSHTRPDGTSYVTALEETNAKQWGYTYSENIYSGSSDPADAVAAWMNSSTDRKNILNAGFTHIAIGYYNNCWVQLFVGTNVTPDDAYDSSNNTSSADTSNIQSIQFFPPVVQVRTNGQHFPTVLDQDFKEVPSGVTWTNETPELFTINKRTRVCEIGETTGTGSLIATVNGRTARLILEIVDSEDKIDLSSTMILSSVGKSQTVQLYVPRNSYFYSQDYTVSWDVQDPNVVQIEEVDTTTNPGIRCTMMNAGTTSVTCTVTLPDGYSTSTSCYVHVAEADQ